MPQVSPTGSQVDNSFQTEVTVKLLEMEKLPAEQQSIIERLKAKNKKLQKDLEDKGDAWKYVAYSDGKDYASLRRILVTTTTPKEKASIFGLAANESKPITVVGIKQNQTWRYHVVTEVKTYTPGFQALYSGAIKDAIGVFKSQFERLHPPRPAEVATETERSHRQHSSHSSHRTSRRSH